MKNNHLGFFKAFFLTSLFTLLGLVGAGTGFAATYYVATNGSDSNPGTDAQPFKTIQKGLNMAYANDTVVVKNGTYIYTGSLDGNWNQFAQSGSAGKYITVKAQNRGGAVLDGNNLARSAFLIDGKNYIKIDGFEMKNCRWDGITTSQLIHDITVVNNYIHDIGRWNYTGTYGIDAFGCMQGSYNCIVDSNIFQNIGRTATENDYHDQYLYMCGNYHTITNNLFIAPPDGAAGGFVTIAAIYSQNDGNNFNITNNTFIGGCRVRPGQVWISLKGGDQCSNVIISNNVSYNAGSHFEVAAFVWVYCWTTASMKSVYVRNNIVSVGTLVSNWNTNWDGTGIISSSNRLNTDPKFKDKYHLDIGSPAIGYANQADAPDHDLDGNPRPAGAGYDAGAYEYQESNPPSDNDPPVVSILSPASSVTINEGEAINFKATASDQEDGDLSDKITWTSDNPGPLGVGAEISPTLSVGQHNVTAEVIDSAGLTGTATVTVTVIAASPSPPPNQAPAVRILYPANGSNFAVGSTITSSGEANDPEDGDLSTYIEWNSDRDGFLGTGANFDYLLTEGNHTVTATVTDKGGLHASSSVLVSVQQTPLSIMDSRVEFYSSGSLRRTNINIEVIVADKNAGVPAAKVTANLYKSGRFWKTITLTTDTNGLAELGLGRQRNTCYKAIVTDVQAKGYLWSGNATGTEDCPDMVQSLLSSPQHPEHLLRATTLPAPSARLPSGLSLN